jgi:CDP-2,3-bis-(O-geranylgeranyl)-sn-glycerol synthase
MVPAGLAHSFWLRSRRARRWRRPIDGGRTWRGRRLFGDNKTWAGFLVLPPATGATFGLLALAVGHWRADWEERLWPLTPGGYALLGCWTGLGFMAGELPNSFVKRQLGVAPGAAPAGRPMRVLGFLIDRTDSLAGALLAQALVVPVGLWYAVYLLLIGPGLHWLFSALLHALGVKGRRS